MYCDVLVHSFQLHWEVRNLDDVPAVHRYMHCARVGAGVFRTRSGVSRHPSLNLYTSAQQRWGVLSRSPM